MALKTEHSKDAIPNSEPDKESLSEEDIEFIKRLVNEAFDKAPFPFGNAPDNSEGQAKSLLDEKETLIAEIALSASSSILGYTLPIPINTSEIKARFDEQKRDKNLDTRQLPPDAPGTKEIAPDEVKPEDQTSAPSPGEKGKSNKDQSETLSLVFEGVVNRTFVANAMRAIREQRELTERDVAEIAGVTQNLIWRIEAEKSSLDKGLEVLEKLGCKVQGEIFCALPSIENDS